MTRRLAGWRRSRWGRCRVTAAMSPGTAPGWSETPDMATFRPASLSKCRPIWPAHMAERHSASEFERGLTEATVAEAELREGKVLPKEGSGAVRPPTKTCNTRLSSAANCLHSLWPCYKVQFRVRNVQFGSRRPYDAIGIRGPG